MGKWAAFGVAAWASMSAMAGEAAADEIDSAILAWVANVSGSPGWEAGYDSIGYDATTDTSVVSGLYLRYALEAAHVSFRDLTIVGYAEQPDGSFAIDELSAAEVYYTGPQPFTDVVLLDVRLTDLSIPAEPGADFTWDTDAPFSSLMHAYGPLADVRFEHGSVGWLNVFTYLGADSASYAIEDVLLERWVGGQIASMTTGAVTLGAAAGLAPPAALQAAGPAPADQQPGPPDRPAPSGPSSALVGADDPSRLVQIMESQGYPATLTTDSFDDPLILSEVDGTEFRIVFYGCSNNADCDTLLFAAEYDTDTDLDVINEWNSDQLFGRAYDDGFGAVLEFGLKTAGGISQANFESVLARWSGMMRSFAERIGL